MDLAQEGTQRSAAPHNSLILEAAVGALVAAGPQDGHGITGLLLLSELLRLLLRLLHKLLLLLRRLQLSELLLTRLWLSEPLNLLLVRLLLPELLLSGLGLPELRPSELILSESLSVEPLLAEDGHSQTNDDLKCNEVSESVFCMFTVIMTTFIST